MALNPTAGINSTTSVKTNKSSLIAQEELRIRQLQKDKDEERLASGKRINKAADDAAGLLISNRLTAQINGVYQANNNASMGIAVAQTAEGAMGEITDMLQRVRDLAVQSANGTLTDDDRAALQQEADALSQEITRVSEKTEFAGETILQGTNSSLGDNGQIAIQVGANSGDTVNIDLSQSMDVGSLADSAIAANPELDGFLTEEGTIDISSAEAAQNAIAGIDAMLGVVDSSRGELGSSMNRFESTIRNNSNIHANVSDARSRVRDTDYAEAVSNYILNKILADGATSMLTQANNRPQSTLGLLKND